MFEFSVTVASSLESTVVVVVALNVPFAGCGSCGTAAATRRLLDLFDLTDTSTSHSHAIMFSIKSSAMPWNRLAD